MYGTIARMQIKPGAEERLSQLSREFEALEVSGFVGSFVYRMDTNPNECYLAVVFRDKASYVANAQSTEQDARYRQIRELLESDPEWHDGEIVHAPAFVTAAAKV
jgi:quinol monooxygenase YgiN